MCRLDLGVQVHQWHSETGWTQTERYMSWVSRKEEEVEKTLPEKREREREMCLRLGKKTKGFYPQLPLLERRV